MTLDDRHYHYQSLVSEGDRRKFVISSIVLHFILLATVLVWQFALPPGQTLTLAGGGGGGPTIGIGLVAGLPAGQEYFKPPVKAPEPAAEPVPAPAPASEQSRPDDFVATAKPDKKPAPPPPPAATQPAPAPTPPGPVATGEQPTGVRGGTGQGGQGAGAAGGVSVGGAGEGFFDSWYARQVEQRVGSNWLESRMGIQFKGKHRTLIQFSVSPEGRIEDVQIVESTGPDAFERAALRAVRASDPLPPLPVQYRMQRNRVRFVAIFEYPTP
jgi:TonB family protein